MASRLASTLTLAALASAGALAALAIRTDVAGTWRVIGATALFALIYAGVGVLVGALVRSELNGSLIVVFAWIFDVFFGPAMGGSAPVLRLFPMHFPTLVVTDVASGHSGALGDLGISLLWATATIAAASIALVVTTRPHEHATRPANATRRRVSIALGAAGRQLRRMPVMWILIIGLPVAFISSSIAVTPDDPTPVELAEIGRRSLSIISMADVHGAIMVPITIGFLASLAGLFVILDSAQADRRLSLTQCRPGEILGVRMTVIAGASLVATAVSIAVTAVSFDAVSWPIFVGANVLVALTYATIGVIVGPVFGRPTRLGQVHARPRRLPSDDGRRLHLDLRRDRRPAIGARLARRPHRNGGGGVPAGHGQVISLRWVIQVSGRAVGSWRSAPGTTVIVAFECSRKSRAAWRRSPTRSCSPHTNSSSVSLMPGW